MSRPSNCTHEDWPCCGCGDLQDEENACRERIEADVVRERIEEIEADAFREMIEAEGLDDSDCHPHRDCEPEYQDAIDDQEVEDRL